VWRQLLTCGVFVACFAGPAASALADSKPFRIQVVDDETGRGVPLVELQTVNNIRLFTDSNGVIAFNEPGLENQSVFFHVKSHGYEFPADGFGFRGQALEVRAGQSATLKIKRLNIAQRLYRVTGAGIYRDSVLTGDKAPIREAVINGLVLGSDSVVNALYRGKIHWFWGDTNRPAYPLGNFHVPGATSDLPDRGGLDPQHGIDLAYFVDDKGFARPTAQMPGDGPTWIDGLVVLPDETGREKMFAAYVKVKPPLDVYQHGLAEYDDESNQFKKVFEFDNKAPVYPGGHPVIARDGDVEYIYFCRPYPLARVRAAVASLTDLSQYEAYTCLQAGSRLEDPQIDRDQDGRARYSWKRKTPAVGPFEQAKLIADRHLRPEEALLQLADRDSGKPVAAHGGSVYWNEFRRRWVMIAVESRGSSSFLGEVWYAEADSPLGPWAWGVKVVTHNKYSFYNPKQHPMFDKDGGRKIFFEGTYTHSFSGNTDQTPRYDYNQIMYQLNLDDPRVAMPVAIYKDASDRGLFTTRTATKPEEATAAPDLNRIAFFALDRPGVDTIVVCRVQTVNGNQGLKVDDPLRTDSAKRSVAFHALAANAKNPPPSTVPLYEFVDAAGDRRAYSTDAALSLPGFERREQPLCRVWRNPWRR
jgi:hypothetical protein